MRRLGVYITEKRFQLNDFGTEAASQLRTTHALDICAYMTLCNIDSVDPPGPSEVNICRREYYLCDGDTIAIARVFGGIQMSFEYRKPITTITIRFMPSASVRVAYSFECIIYAMLLGRSRSRDA